MRQTIYAIRHGRTAYNAAHRLQGSADIELDEQGRAQATAVGTRLHAVSLAVAWVSPLLRARQTAELAMVAAGQGMVPQVQPLVAERDFGPHEGKPLYSLQAEFPGLPYLLTPSGHPLYLDLPHAESMDALRARAQSAVDALLPLIPAGGAAVIFSHAGFLRTLHAVLTGVSVDHAFTQVAIGNCDVLVYTLDHGVVTDVAHWPCPPLA